MDITEVLNQLDKLDKQLAEGLIGRDTFSIQRLIILLDYRFALTSVITDGH
jgi:hypothetical protein